MTAANRHDYLSTACGHGQCDECRQSCKFCDSSCQHDCHPQSGVRELPPPWVDQARDGFVRLLSVLTEHGVDLGKAEPDLYQAIRYDPAWFWARGEVQPHGEWRPPVPAEPLLNPDCRDGKCGSCVGGPCEHSCHST